MVVAVDSLSLSAGQLGCRSHREPAKLAECMAAYDQARGAANVPADLLKATLSGLASWLMLRDPVNGGLP